jgi:hypothetical protein
MSVVTTPNNDALLTGGELDQLNVTATIESVSTSNTAAAQSTSQLFFQCVVILIGCVGTLSNGTVLVALSLSKKIKKNLLNIPILNQLTLDLYSSIVLVIVYSVRVCNFYLVGTSGYWLCMLLTGEMLLWSGLNASVIKMAVIIIERYTSKSSIPLGTGTTFARG